MHYRYAMCYTYIILFNSYKSYEVGIAYLQYIGLIFVNLIHEIHNKSSLEARWKRLSPIAS